MLAAFSLIFTLSICSFDNMSYPGLILEALLVALFTFETLLLSPLDSLSMASDSSSYSKMVEAI